MQAIKDFIRSGIDVNIGITGINNERAFSPLYTEINKLPAWDKNNDNRLSIIKLLLDAGADPNIKYGSGHNSPFVIACFNNNSGDSFEKDIINIFIQYGADPNAIDERSGDSIFQHLIRRVFRDSGYVAIIKTLIEKGADINKVSDGGYTPMSMALRMKNFAQEEKKYEAVKSYDDLIALLKKHGATETSLWEKMKRRF